MRLYTLDRQVQHGDRDSQEGFGKWLSRRWKHALSKRAEGDNDVKKSGFKLTEIRDQWAMQVDSQTKPLPRKYNFLLLNSYNTGSIVSYQVSHKMQEKRQLKRLYV